MFFHILFHRYPRTLLPSLERERQSGFQPLPMLSLMTKFDCGIEV